MLNKILQSSKDANKVSLSVKGILMQVSAFVVFAGGVAGYSVAGPIEGLVDSISTFVGTSLLLVGQVQLVWGLVRKIKINKG